MRKPSNRGRAFVVLDLEETYLAATALNEEMSGWRRLMSRPDFQPVAGFKESLAITEALLERLRTRLATTGLKL